MVPKRRQPQGDAPDTVSMSPIGYAPPETVWCTELMGMLPWRAAFLQDRHQDCRPSWLCSRRKKSTAFFIMWHLLHCFCSTVGTVTVGRAACGTQEPPILRAATGTQTDRHMKKSTTMRKIVGIRTCLHTRFALALQAIMCALVAVKLSR